MGTDQTEEGNLQALVAIVKEALIEQSEQGIQDGAVGLEDLIYEGHFCCRQVAVCLACVLIVLQSCRSKTPPSGKTQGIMTAVFLCWCIQGLDLQHAGMQCFPPALFLLLKYEK